YQNVTMDRICAYTKAMFSYWTEGELSSDFRKMLTLEQYRDPSMNRLFHQYLAAGPADYMKDVFRPMADSGEEAAQLALAFYGPVFLLYSLYDQAEDKQVVMKLLDQHLEQFKERNLK
ncbi:MAG: TetR/AcrR family transcriptional regulator, partial [Anaerovoracaceae bacterium]